MDAVTTLTLISKPDCHLCDVAREVIDVVISELPESDVEVAELSILDDPALYATWWEKIPACSSTIACMRTGGSMPRVCAPPWMPRHPGRRCDLRLGIDPAPAPEEDPA
jgi:hypothetical protein